MSVRSASRDTTPNSSLKLPGLTSSKSSGGGILSGHVNNNKTTHVHKMKSTLRIADMISSDSFGEENEEEDELDLYNTEKHSFL